MKKCIKYKYLVKNGLLKNLTTFLTYCADYSRWTAVYGVLGFEHCSISADKQFSSSKNTHLLVFSPILSAEKNTTKRKVKLYH